MTSSTDRAAVVRTVLPLGVVLLLGLTACSGGSSAATGQRSPSATRPPASTAGTPVPTFCTAHSPVVAAPGGTHRIVSPAAIGTLRLQPLSPARRSTRAAFVKRFAGSGATLAAFEEYDGPAAKAFVTGVVHLPGEYYKARVNYLCGAASGVAVSATPLALDSPGHPDSVLCFDGPADSGKAVEVCGWVDDTAVVVTVKAADAAAARAVAVQVRSAVEQPAQRS